MYEEYYDPYFELLDFPGMVNQVGKNVKIEKINFSFLLA